MDDDEFSTHVSLGIYSELYVDILYWFILTVIEITKIDIYNEIDLNALEIFLRQRLLNQI